MRGNLDPQKVRAAGPPFYGRKGIYFMHVYISIYDP